MPELGEQLTIQLEQLVVADKVVESADKPGSYLMAIREAFYAGLDIGTAYADGYVDEEDTKFELWYASKFLKSMEAMSD